MGREINPRSVGTDFYSRGGEGKENKRSGLQAAYLFQESKQEPTIRGKKGVV